MLLFFWGSSHVWAVGMCRGVATLGGMYSTHAPMHRHALHASPHLPLEMPFCLHKVNGVFFNKGRIQSLQMLISLIFRHAL
jgi:hypothetical protein